MDWDSIVFNSCALIAGLFVLQYGADLFIVHTAIVAQRVGVSETLVALLTAGAEWEELAVVVASIVQRRSSIGLGNVIGSSISNILGAFSLGLLMYPERMAFDRSAKIYSGALFIVTTVFTVLALTGHLDFTGGIFFLVAFAVYLFSVGSAIYEGLLDTPAEEDSDSDEDEEEAPVEPPDPSTGGLGISVFPTTVQVHPLESSPLIPNGIDDTEEHKAESTRESHGLAYHIFILVIGFLALSLSGYVLSHAASSLATSFHLSGTVLGITILAFATTLPEKLLSILSGYRGHSGILVATTAGSNIFLLTLCLGVIFIARGEGDDKKELGQSLVAFEVWTAWACSLVLMVIVFVGGRRWMGGLLLGFYGAFIGTEFAVFRR